MSFVRSFVRSFIRHDRLGALLPRLSPDYSALFRCCQLAHFFSTLYVTLHRISPRSARRAHRWQISVLIKGTRERARVTGLKANFQHGVLAHSALLPLSRAIIRKYSEHPAHLLRASPRAFPRSAGMHPVNTPRRDPHRRVSAIAKRKFSRFSYVSRMFRMFPARVEPPASA
jgi:hypothetical protein